MELRLHFSVSGSKCAIHPSSPMTSAGIWMMICLLDIMSMHILCVCGPCVNKSIILIL